MINKHGRIGRRTTEPLGKKKTDKFMKPSTGSLLEAINSFLELANMGRKVRVNKPRWLTHINLLSEITMKKSVFNIQLSYRPSKNKS